MKKVFLFFAVLCACNMAFAFSGFKAPSAKANQIFIPIGKDKQISLMNLSLISVKDFQLVTGKHMNFFERINFKIAQRKLRNSINADGTLNNRKLEKRFEANNMAASGKSQLVALLLCFFVGVLGIHRFYLGYTWQGIVQLLTLGGLGIWTLIDFIRIIIGDLQPKNGEYETTL